MSLMTPAVIFIAGIMLGLIAGLAILSLVGNRRK